MQPTTPSFKILGLLHCQPLPLVLEPIAQEVLARECYPPRDQPTRSAAFREVRLGSGSGRMAPGHLIPSLFNFTFSLLPSLGTSLHGGTRQGLRFSPQQQMSGALLNAIFNRNNLLPGRLAGKSASHWGVFICLYFPTCHRRHDFKDTFNKGIRAPAASAKALPVADQMFFYNRADPVSYTTLGGSFHASLDTADT